MTSFEQARDLIYMADQDYLVLEKLEHDKSICDETWGFHAQQSAEKIFKSLLAVRNIDFPYTHHLGQLIDQLEEVGFELPDVTEDFYGLTAFAGGLRYGPFLEKNSLPPLDRADIRQKLAQFRDFVRRQAGL